MARTDEAVILAGGFGTRLQSVVSDVPKPLAPIDGKPFLAFLLDRLVMNGFRRVVLATGYMGDKVYQALGDRWHGMSLIYSQEQQPLGTGGAIAKAFSRIDGEAFFVLNGDTYLELDYNLFDEQAIESGAKLGMALAQVPDVARYGAVQVQEHRVTGFSEKGLRGPGYINAGVYRLAREVAANFPAIASFSFENDILVPAVQNGQVQAFTQTAAFIDIGVPEDYSRAQRELAKSANEL
jgi:D-glycero-alpha-D-manno-heptose 1-phosphate guanylyltransferase